eukprot:30614-Pelagococcus_subviridis.AAC.1
MSHSPNGLNRFSTFPTLGSALNPRGFNDPISTLSRKAVTMKLIVDVPGGMAAPYPARTVRDVPVGFTVTALLPCLSSTNPNTSAASTTRFRLFVAVAVNLRHTVFALGPFHTSERRGGVERRQLKLKGAEGGE